jgi:hypothetical protein
MTHDIRLTYPSGIQPAKIDTASRIRAGQLGGASWLAKPAKQENAR